MATPLATEEATTPPAERCDVCQKPPAEHVGDIDFEVARADCDRDHDPHPMVTASLAMAQRSFGGRKLFRPRREYCADETHYVLREETQ